MVLDKRDYIIFFFFVALDQLTKIIVLLTRPDNFLFGMTWNTGASFGMFRDHNTILAVIAIAVLFILWKPLKMAKGHEKTALVLLYAGIVGNLIDRLAHRAVLDFIDFFSFINFPLFNIADALITCSVLYLLGKALRETYQGWQFKKKGADGKKAK